MALPVGSGLVVAVASVAGLAAFLYPFLLPALMTIGPANDDPRAAEAPLVLALVASACLTVILLELSSSERRGAPGPRAVALLAALVALDALLRLVPTIGGASPVFGLILLVGAAFGPASGFTMGALTLLISAMITGGIGPWLPYQMLAAGWVGLSAGWLRGRRSRPPAPPVLAIVAGAWGLLYGGLMNLYSWPFLAPGIESGSGIYWEAGLGIAETVERYRAYYFATSFAHDLLRAVANTVFIVLLGPSVLHLLERFSLQTKWADWEA